MSAASFDGARNPGAMRGYVRLPDGRRLSYMQWGDPAGRPVLEFRRLPSSSLGDATDHTKLAEAQVRRITVDRPGVGFSDPQPGRALLDWPDGVCALVNSLRLDRFAVLGTSGGGPYAACCVALPDRISRAALVSALGPLDRPGALSGMNRGEARTMILARRARCWHAAGHQAAGAGDIPPQMRIGHANSPQFAVHLCG